MAGFTYLQKEWDSFKEKGSVQSLPVLESSQRSRVVLEGREMVQLSSNNYLGLATHPRLTEAAMAAIQQYGAGTASVRTIAGTFTIHEAFEQKLASFKRTESALVFQSGFTANIGVLTSLLSDKDVVISDALNHASIIDGIRLTKAARRIYNHSNMDELEKALADTQNHRNRLIVTDGVFSMDGDIARLPEIVELAEQYDALVMVDDAHASGVLGENGRGSVDHFGLNGRVHIQVGTLSKAIGVLGGYIASERVVCDYLTRHARPFLFSTSHPPAVTAACSAAVDVLGDEPELINQLWENTRFFKQGLTDLGYDTGMSETPITPVIVGEVQKAISLSDLLRQHGVFAQHIGFPTVPKGKARVRTIVTAAHSREELQQALDAFAFAGKHLGLI